MSFITELFNGNISPSDKGFKQGSDYDKVLKALLECDDRLENELGDELKQYFSEMIDAHDEFLDISVLESFEDGFRLGAGFMLDTFVVGDNGTAKIHRG